MTSYYDTATSDTWQYWSTTGASSDAATNSSAWTTWTDLGTGAMTVSGGHAWRIWTTGTEPLHVIDGTFTQDSEWSIWATDDGVQIRSHSQEEAQEINHREEAARREANERYEKLQESKKRAEDRAKELLLDLIGEEELKVYERTGRVMVKGRKHDYIVSRDGSFVKRIEKDKIVDLCIHLAKSCPETDNVIALKLLAEADEEALNEIANNHGSRDRPQELPECACG